MQARSKKIAFAVVAVVALAAVGGVLMSGGEAKAPAAKATVPPLEFAAADLATAEKRSLVRSLAFSGSLQPVMQATVKAKVAGDIVDIGVREGQSVRLGQLLLRINPVNLQAQFDAQQAALEKARAEFSIASKNRDNNASLLKQKFISQNAFDATHSQYDAAAANVRAAEAQLRLAQTALRDASVAAPQAGIVSRRYVQAGEKVSVDTPLIGIVDLDKLEIEAPLAATDVAAVKVGQPVRFQVDGFPGRDFEGKVERINPVTDNGSRSITVYISASNPKQALRGGMFAQGVLELERTPELLVVPATALREEAGSHHVLTIEDGKLAKREVKPGLRDEQRGLVEVRDGLAAGAQLVRHRIPGLKVGSAVVIKAAG